LQKGLNALSRELGLTRHLWCEGYPCSPLLQFRGREGRVSAELQTLFVQEMIRRGILLSYIAVSYSHTMEEVDETLDAAREAMAICRQGLEEGISRFLDGPSVRPVFRRFN
jgi:glutamate-1-semialdehyde 2,1-aminomutase